MRVLPVFCLALAIPVQPPSSTPAESLIERRVADRRLPGAVLLVEKNGRVETLRAFGDADAAGRRPMRTDTLFRLASAAKIVTTAGVLCLVDDGRVALDRAVDTYLPEFHSLRVFTDPGTRPPVRPLRVRDLLRHTSGYGYGNHPRQGAAYEAAGTQVASDMAQGEAAGVDSTPTLYFNNRKYKGPMHPKYIEMWIDEELAVNR